jgi:hypothetical protein
VAGVVTHTVVKVVFLCPEDHGHVLGAVSRQVKAVPGSDAGREIWFSLDNGKLELDTFSKLHGRCQTCHRADSSWAPQITWTNVRKLLDAAEATEDGVLIVPMAF